MRANSVISITAARERGTPRRQRIANTLVAVCSQAFGEQLCGLILTGSVARGEESVITGASGEILLGDVEFIAVLHERAELPAADAREKLCRDIEAGLHERGVHSDVSAAVVHPHYLRNLPPHIFSYELKHCGQVVYGEPSLLELIPAMDAGALDREDAWRMLGNRLIELLPLVSSEPLRKNDALHYAALKLCLDIATSLLVFLGAYEPTYRGREQRFRRLAAESSPRCEKLPFALEPFLQRLAACTSAKLAPAEHALDAAAFCGEIIAYAREAWLWELRIMTGNATVAPKEPAVRSLVADLATARGRAARLRGWAYVVRRRGWLRSLVHWPRWMRIAMRYSPRYALYLAAFEMYGAEPTSAALDGIATLLPCCPPETVSRRQLAAELYANYREFVVGTRA